MPCRSALLALAACAGLACARGARAEDAPAAPAPRRIVVAASHVHVGDGTVHSPGQILVEDGVVKAVGTTVEAPDDAERWAFPEGHVTPWLVDPVVTTSLAQGEAGRGEAILLSAADARPLQDPWWAELRARGLGAAGFVPSGGSGLQGRTATAGSLESETSASPLLAADVAAAFALPESVAGSTARAVARLAPAQILEEAETARRQKQQADEKRRQGEGRVAVARDKPGGPKPAGERPQPPPQPAQEALLTIVDKKLPLLVALSRPQDALAVLALAEQRGLGVTLVGCRACGAVADEIARSQAVVVLDPLHAPQDESNGLAPDPEAAARLARAGARLAVTGGGGWPDGPLALRAAAAALAGAGVPRELAVAAMTGRAAAAAGIPSRGLLATGQPARFVAWTGDPLDPRSRVARAAEPEDLKAAAASEGAAP